MKLACSTWMIPGETFDEKMKNAARYGFDGVEIRLFEKDYSPTIIKEIIRAGQGAGVNPCSLIMPDVYKRQVHTRKVGGSTPLAATIFKSDRIYMGA